MSARFLVIGASGEVGEGIVAELIDAGHDVVASARSADGLTRLADRLGRPAALETITGTLADMASADRLADAAGPLLGVVLVVSGRREAVRLDQLSPEMLADSLAADVLTHFTAVRTFLPRLPREGCLVGIGGGSANFILDGGAHLSMAQAALRQMYRGFAHEHRSGTATLRQLIVASVVAGRRHGQADPAWVTPREIGGHVLRLLMAPGEHPGTIWRIARRDERGLPQFGCEEATPAKVLPL